MIDVYPITDKAAWCFTKDPVLFAQIPRDLLNAVVPEGIVERFYAYGPKVIQHPLTFFYLLLEEGALDIKGVMWLTADVIAGRIQAQLLTVSKEYQHHHIMDKTMELAIAIADLIGASHTIEMATRRPKPFTRYGWKVSDAVLMEHTNE